MAFSAGSAYVSVLPSMDGFKKKIQAEVKTMFADGIKIPVEAQTRGIREQLTAATRGVTASVKVDLDKSSAARVQAQVEALAAKLAKARDAEADAAGRVRVEEAKLEEVRNRGNASASRLAAAEERLASSKRNSAAATRQAASVETALASARSRLSSATDGNGRALGRNNRALGESTIRAAALARSLKTIALPAALVAASPYVLSLASSLVQAAGAAALLPAAFAAAGAGVATLIMGLSGVGEAFKELSAQDDAAATTAASAGKARQAALDSVRSAQDALADAQRAADRAAVDGAEQVADAREAVANAVTDANRQMEAAEDDLTRAQESARRAQEALTQARSDAKRELKELQFSVEGAGLAEKEAADRLQEARQRLAAARRGGAGAEEIDDLGRAVQQADLSLREATYRYGQLKAEGKSWARTGIEGSRGVVDAQRQLEDANEGVSRAEQAQREARLAGDAAVAAARRDLARTIVSVGQQQEDATRAVTRASEALAKAQTDAGAAGAGGASKAAAAMGKLSPAAQAVVNKVRALGPAWKSAQLHVQEKLLAGIAGKIGDLSGAYLPVLRNRLGGLAEGYNLAAKNAANALLEPKTIQDTSDGLANLNIGTRAAAGATGPLVRAFRDLTVVGSSFLPSMGRGFAGLAVRFEQFIANARKAGDLKRWIQDGINVLRQMWQLVVNVGSIFKSVFGAVNRTGQSFLTTLVQITGRIAAALKTPEGAAGLQSFFGTIRGLVGGFFDKLVQLWPVIQATAQSLMFFGQFLSPVFNMLSLLAPVLGPIIAALLTATAIMKVATLVTAGWTAATWLFNAALNANPIMKVITVIGLLVGAVMYAWNNFSWFRTAVTAVWSAIRTVAMIAWNGFLKPVFTAIGAVLRVVGGVFMWLWRNIVQPVFTFIGNVVRVVWNATLGPIFRALWAIIRTVGRVVSWLWREIFQPVFQAIGIIVGRAWGTVLQPIFNAIKSVVRGVGNVFNWLRHNIIQPVWSGISTAISVAWNVVKPVFNFFKGAAEKIGEAFQGLKKVMKDVFEAIWGILKKPVQFVIDVVWNKSLRLVVNGARWIAGKEALPEVKLAKGGVIPGYAPGKDTVPAMVSPGEAWLVPELTRIIGKKRIEAANAAAMKGRGAGANAVASSPAITDVTQFFAKGGVAGKVKKPQTAASAAPAAAAADPAAGLGPATAGLTGTLGTLTEQTEEYKAAVLDLSKTALNPLQTQIKSQLNPTFVAAGAQQVRTGQTTRVAWQQTTKRVVGNQNTLQARQTVLGQGMRNSWNNINVATRNSVTGQNRSYTNLRTGMGTTQRRQTTLAQGMRNSWNNISAHTRGSVASQQRSYSGLQAGMTRVRQAMSQTASWAGTQFNRMYNAAAGPARRIISGPFNQGIIKAWNRLASDFSLKPKKVAGIVPGFAQGGDLHGPGTGTSDSFMIRASDGEFMVRQRIAERTRPFLRALNDGQPEAVQAAGGWHARGPKGYARGGDVNKPARNDALARGIKFARKESGKPYSWGGVGPHGYDCSGFMSAITNVLRGQNPHQRLGVAASQPWSGFQRGLKGSFATGFSSGHTAGTLAGTNVESGGSPSRVKFGAGAAGADDSQFPGHAWLPMVGGKFVSGGGGGSVDPASLIGPAFDPVNGMINSVLKDFPGNKMAIDGGKIAQKAIKGVRAFATKKLEEALMTDPGGAGVQRWRPMVKRALSIVGQPQSKANMTLRRMDQESGGDPNIVNDWDSNWTAGHPSVGLMQCIRGTYQDHVPPKFDVGPYKYGVSVSPLANTLASMRYALSDYGSLDAAYNKSGGYDDGGLAYGEGYLSKFTQKPERVLNPTNTKSFDTLVHMIRTGRLHVGGDGAESSSGGPLVGELNMNFAEGTSASGAFDEALFEMRKIRRGG